MVAVAEEVMPGIGGVRAQRWRVRWRTFVGLWLNLYKLFTHGSDFEHFCTQTES